MPKQIPKSGDVFLITLADGRTCIGQVVETEAILMNSITCAFFSEIFQEGASNLTALLRPGNVLACQFVTRDLFNKGLWRRIGNHPVAITDDLLPFRETKAKGWIGASVRGSGNMHKLMNAYHGLDDWGGMKDPDYYQKLLLPGRRGPQTPFPGARNNAPSKPAKSHTP
jgi:hypothetical protein